MAYENVRRFTKPHKSEEGTGGGGTTIYIGGAQSGIINATTVNAANVEANRIHSNSIESTNAKFKYIMSEYGEITKIEGTDINYTNGHISSLTSSDITTDGLTVKDTATIENIINTNLNSKNIVTDYLTVNKSAHFFELIVDKIRSVQGTQMNTAANCIVDYVHAFNSSGQMVSPTANNVAYYRIYWKNTDDDGRAITNDWLVLDQALCESFNVQTGTSYDVSNKYYWRKVIRTDGGTPKYVNFNTGAVRNTEPSDYEIVFSNRFEYGESGGQNNYTNFNIESQITNEWDDTNNTWTVGTTQYGLQLTIPDADLVGNGTLMFTTNIQTQLNVGVYYNDGTFDYFPANGYNRNYSITTTAGKIVEAFIIVSAILDKFDACNWIDLSNSDMDATVSGKSAIPSIGDNVCQLGYRYTELTNPTQDDINRASAIIIAAYNTPDSGIVPPSYAQYQQITDYSLSSHRKSYFDATGCYIVGNFAVQASGGNIPLDQYIQSFNSANPCDISVITDYANKVDLIILQTNNSSAITNINNFPTNLQVTPTISGAGAFPGAYTYNSFTLSMFGIIYDLLTFDNTDPTQYLPVGYEGIYLKRVDYSSLRYYKLEFDFTGTSQTITTSSVVISIALTHISSGNSYSYTKSIPVNSVSSVEGTDAELWQLYKDTEYAEVQRNKSLNVQLRYAIQHVVGTTSTIVAPTNQKLKITRYKLDGTALNTTTLTSSDYNSTGGKTGNGYWEYTYTLTNWYTEQNKPVYFLVELLDNNDNILSNTIVDITLESSSLFTVEDGLTQSIQANTTAINDEAQTRQTQYSAISQTVNNINSTVSSHTTSINNMSTEISQIDQKADRIELSVTSVATDLDTLETNIATTGIDIENGKINLNADNTNINGNLNVYNAKQGIIVYDSNNNPKISITADNLGGSYDSYSTNIGQTYDNWYESTTQKTAGTASYTAPIVQVSLGNLKNNTELIFSTSIGSTDWYNENNYIDAFFYTTLIDGNYSHIVSGGTISGATYSFTFSNGSTTITSSGNFTISNNRLYLPNINVTLTADGNWTMSGNVSLTLTGEKQSLASYYCGHQVFYIKGADPSVNKISLDGMLIKPSNSNVNWFGSDMTVLSNGLHEVRVTSNGIKERNYINANTGTYNENPLSCSQKVQMIYNDGTSINDDTTFAFISNNASSINVLLPQSGNNYLEGRTIYIKNNSSRTHNIVANWYSASFSRVIPKDKDLSDVASSSAYDYGRYWSIPAKSQITVVCVHNEDMSIPLWYVF